MTNKDEALQMAIEEIEGWYEDRYGPDFMDRCQDNSAWKACKEAIGTCDQCGNLDCDCDEYEHIYDAD